MSKGSIFGEWNGEQFASLWQMMDLVEVNNSGVHPSFFRSELYLSTKNQSEKCDWKQAEDASGKMLSSLLVCFL